MQYHLLLQVLLVLMLLNSSHIFCIFIISLVYRFVNENFYSIKNPQLFYTNLMHKLSRIFTGVHEFPCFFASSKDLKNFFAILLNFSSLIIHTMVENRSAVIYRQKCISQLHIMLNYLGQSVYSRSFWPRIMHQKTNVICTGGC